MTDAPFKIGDSVYLEKHYKHDTETSDYSYNLPLNKELKVKKIIFNSYVYGNKEKEWVVYLENNAFGHPACKFKLWNEKEIQNNSEFKVGDWIIASIGKVQYIVKLTELNPPSGLFRTLISTGRLISGGSFEKILRKAKLDEIPVKELSDEEILEVCKQYYPVGTKFKSVTQNRIIEITGNYFRCLSKSILIDCNSVNEKSSNWTIYDKTNNKFAEIISTSNQEVKDDFVLPEKWCIKGSKKLADINFKNWKGNPAKYHGDAFSAYYHFDGKEMDIFEEIEKGYTEITLDQFKKYVLGENLIVGTKGNDMDINTKVFENPEEIYIPTITKPKNKIDYTINSVFADIKVNLPEKPKKVVKPIVLEKFNLII